MSDNSSTLLSNAELQRDLLSLVEEVERVLKRRAFDESLSECRTELGNRFRSALSETWVLLRDHSVKMIALVEALAGANRLYSEKIEELSSMRRVSDVLSSTLDLGETCRLASEVLADETGADSCYLFLVDEETRVPVLRAMKKGSETAATFFSRAAPGVEPVVFELAARAVNTCEPVVGTGADESVGGSAGLGQLVCLPLLASGRPIGAVTLVGSLGSGPRPYAGRILGILASQIAAALVHSHLYAKLAVAQKVQTIVETAVTVNHQINNPLAVVLSSVGVLRGQLPKPNLDEIEPRLRDIEKAVSEVQEATQKLASIISPVVEEYANGTKMISLTASDTSCYVSRGEFLNKYKALLEQMRHDAEERSGYEPARTESIAYIGGILGERIGLSSAELEDLRMLCLWHDIGVEAIDEKILRKPATLDNEEMLNVQEHPKISEQLLRPVHGPCGFVKLVRHHHEDVNGKGYPDKLSGAKLPLPVRIHRVVEAYVAMRSDRPFRPAMGPQQAQNELMRCAGLQFDPSVVEDFLGLLLERPGLEELCSHRLQDVEQED